MGTFGLKHVQHARLIWVYSMPIYFVCITASLINFIYLACLLSTPILAPSFSNIIFSIIY